MFNLSSRRQARVGVCPHAVVHVCAKLIFGIGFLSERPCACVPVPRFEKQRRGRGPPLAADLLRFCASRERIAISRAKTGSSSSSFSLPLFEFRVVRAGLKTPAGCPTAGRHAFICLRKTRARSTRRECVRLASFTTRFLSTTMMATNCYFARTRVWSVVACN